MTLAQFILHLIAMLILTGAPTLVVLLGLFRVIDWCADRWADR